MRDCIQWCDSISKNAPAWHLYKIKCPYCKFEDFKSKKRGFWSEQVSEKEIQLSNSCLYSTAVLSFCRRTHSEKITTDSVYYPQLAKNNYRLFIIICKSILKHNYLPNEYITQSHTQMSNEKCFLLEYCSMKLLFSVAT